MQLGNTSLSSFEIFLLDLSCNSFGGPIPEYISEFINIYRLYLDHNDFTGSIPRSLSKLVFLRDLHLSDNKLTGEIPSFVLENMSSTISHNLFSSLENTTQEIWNNILDLSSNSFRGPFPHWVCKIEELELLDLSNNFFTGLIPSCLGNNMVYLKELSLRNNSFSGVLPDIFGNATGLLSFDVSRNQLDGNFPNSLINCKDLQLLNVESNSIKDEFPSWLGSLPSLRVLSLRSNKFYGRLYHRHKSIGFQSLKVMDVSQNDFTGTLSPRYFFSWREMNTLTQGNNYMDGYYEDGQYTLYRSIEMVLKGVDMRFERIREDFRAIDLSGNRFCGKIPISIGFLKELRLLNMSHNAFTDDIPLSLAKLTNLETLDLSSNNLSGEIPQDLGNLSFISYMNFSHNRLQGPVPGGTQFKRQNCSSFTDNPGLYNLQEICGELHVPEPPSQHHEELPEEDEKIFNWIAAAIAYVPGVFCGMVIGYIFTSYKQEWFT
ncbi:receptor like protein 11 [Raphanus sativus]|nr:receptor like protein 11 [Raphanus sativus]